jgi:hypothetical protein
MTDEKYIIFESELGELMMEYVNRPLSPSQYIARSAFGDTIRSRLLAKSKPGDCPDCPILTGDDAKRFTEYINNPPAKSPAALELIRQAADLAKVKVPETVPEEFRKIWNKYMEEHDAEIAREENKRVLDAIKEYTRHHGYWYRIKEDEKRYHWEPARFDGLLKSLRIQEPPK